MSCGDLDVGGGDGKGFLPGWNVGWGAGYLTVEESAGMR